MLSLKGFERASISSLAVALAAFACDAGTTSDRIGSSGGTSAYGGSANAASAGRGTGATGNVGGRSTGSAGAIGSVGGTNTGSGGSTGARGGTGSSAGGRTGSAGSTGGVGGGAVVVPQLPPLVTSASGAYWKTDGMLTESTAAATVTVNDTATAQKWDGMGAAFNELGWKYLTTTEMQNKAIGLLFSASDGANFAWGRIPIGASDYAESRYTLEDTDGANPTPSDTNTGRPSADTALSRFSLARDKMKLIPYVKAAQAVKKDLRFWASPWTPPLWMKTGFMKLSGVDRTSNAPYPSYYDGGNMKSDDETLKSYAAYYTNFVKGYLAEGISIEVVSPQNEPGYDQNYPSCLWDKATYTTFIGSHLGPAMKTLGVKVMLGTLSNANTDFDIAAGPIADTTAKTFLTVVGAQWNTLNATKLNALNSGLPIWATEHKCGNYPFCTQPNQDGCPAQPYDSSKAPNDQNYAVESWGYIRDAIKTIKVTAYNAWNMVLDKDGLGIDKTREWKQNALLVADGGMVTPTPAYYVFRHISQYAQPNATVIGTTGGDAIAFKNPDGSLVAVMFNSGAGNPNYVLAIGSKKFQFSMPANGWATVKYKP